MYHKICVYATEYEKKIEKIYPFLTILLTFIFLYATLTKVMKVNGKNFKAYDEELDYYFLVCVTCENGVFYAYNRRTLVRDKAFAKRFETLRSARRCIKLSGQKNCEIIKVKRF